MTGLILKDLLILRRTLRTYLLFIAIYVGLAFSGVWSLEFACGFIMVLTAMLPMNVFSYDKQAKWDTYGLALPVGRTKTVAARYLCVLLLLLFSVAIECAIGGMMAAMGKLEHPGTFLFTSAVCGLMALLTNAAMLPFLYKFGPERARVMLLGFMGLIVLVGGLLLSGLLLVPLSGIAWLRSLEEPTAGQAAALPVIAALAGLVLLALSFLISRHFYGTKDV